jgi:hypothetical protein
MDIRDQSTSRTMVESSSRVVFKALVSVICAAKDDASTHDIAFKYADLLT